MTGKINDREKYGGLSQIIIMYLPVADLSSFFSEVNKFSTEISVFVTCLRSYFNLQLLILLRVRNRKKRHVYLKENKSKQ